MKQKIHNKHLTGNPWADEDQLCAWYLHFFQVLRSFSWLLECSVLHSSQRGQLGSAPLRRLVAEFDLYSHDSGLLRSALWFVYNDGRTCLCINWGICRV